MQLLAHQLTVEEMKPAVMMAEAVEVEVEEKALDLV